MKIIILAFAFVLPLTGATYAFDVKGTGGGYDSLLGADANVCHREPWRCDKNARRHHERYERDYGRRDDRRDRSSHRSRQYRDWND
jgi:hypothetical protein